MKNGGICLIVLFVVMFASFAQALEHVDETQGVSGAVITEPETKQVRSETVTAGSEIQQGVSETLSTGYGIENPALALAPPTATVALDASSSCSSGRLNIAVTTPIALIYEFGRATTSTGNEISNFSNTDSPKTSYTGLYGFPFSSTVPDQTIVTLYGYMGQNPPKAANTAEFSITYRCDTKAVLASCAGPYGHCTSGPSFPALDGRWFKLNAAVKGWKVSKGNGVISPKNFTVNFYMGFAWNAASNYYDVSLYTKTAPNVWTKTYTTTKTTPTITQNFLADFGLGQLYVNNNTDYVGIWHTPYLKYVMNKAGELTAATYSGSGEVYGGSFDSNASSYFGSIKISGSMVGVSKLPFTP